MRNGRCPPAVEQDIINYRVTYPEKLILAAAKPLEPNTLNNVKEKARQFASSKRVVQRGCGSNQSTAQSEAIFSRYLFILPVNTRMHVVDTK